jgi:hypothetical protein
MTFGCNDKEPTENILWRWVPSKEQIDEDRKHYGDIAEEYIIQKRVYSKDEISVGWYCPGGIIVYGKYHGNEWIANPMERYVIVELMKRLGIFGE